MQNNSMKSPYSILGISPNADIKEARSAFRSIAKSCHPDVNSDPEARQIFEDAQEAYRVITGAAASADKDLFVPSRLKRMVEIDLPISIWTAASGGIIKGKCALGKANIKVPAGARTGDRIIVKIEGKSIACVIKVNEADDFRAEGSDIATVLRITASQAKNGGFAEIDTPSGKYRVKVPANTPDGARLRIENRGLPAAKTRAAGHLYLDIEIIENITDKAVSSLDKILERARRPRAKSIEQNQDSKGFGFFKKSA